MAFFLGMSRYFRNFAVYKLSVSPFKSGSYMTKDEFKMMFRLFADVITDDKDDLFSYAPSAHFIENCGGYELELHPSGIVWGKGVSCLSLMADNLCMSVECRFYDGSIIIR